LRLIKQILPPRVVRAAEVADDLAVDVRVERLRALEQPHARFVRRAVAFAVVARPAAGDEVLPSRGAAPRARYDVVERQILRRRRVAAVLARVVVAQEDVLSREAL